MIISRCSILGTLAILISLGMLARSASAQTKQIDFTPSTQSFQTTEVRQVEFTLTADRYPTFSALIQQAEFLAKGFIEQGFAQTPSSKRISVKISGERNGQSAPLLFSEVSRSDWQRQPNIQYWSKGFSTSAVLLGFLKPPLQQAASPGVAGTSNQPSASPGVADTSNQPSASPGVADTSNQPSASPVVANTSNQPSASSEAADTSRAIDVRSNRPPAGFR